MISVLLLLPQSSSSSPCHVPAIYKLGDSNSDTDSQPTIFGRAPFPNGQTFFGKPFGRYSGGWMIIDFLALKTAVLELVPRFTGIEFHTRSEFRFQRSHRPASYKGVARRRLQSVTFHYQVLQFQQLKERTSELRKQGEFAYRSRKPSCCDE
ncbi:GDSL esterase/lipase At3g26430 [Linum perenne]